MHSYFLLTLGALPGKLVDRQLAGGGDGYGIELCSCNSAPAVVIDASQLEVNARSALGQGVSPFRVFVFENLAERESWLNSRRDRHGWVR